MRLAEAKKAAEGAARLFEPFCERIAIAGSIRRERPECGDVDLVCIPKVIEHRDLLGQVERVENLLLGALVDYVAANEWVKWTNGKAPEGSGKIFSVTGRHAVIEFYCAAEMTWATTLLTRTGSKEHNIWISERARAWRCAFKASEGIYVGGGGGMVHPASEEEFYQLLGLPLIAPAKRERMELMRLEVGR